MNNNSKWFYECIVALPAAKSIPAYGRGSQSGSEVKYFTAISAELRVATVRTGSTDQAELIRAIARPIQLMAGGSVRGAVGKSEYCLGLVKTLAA